MIEILGISIKGYKIKHFVSTFFLSEENPKNVVRIGLKIIFEEEVKEKVKEEKMKIYFRLKPISKICKEADISYKLREGTYIRGVGAEYEKVIPLVFNTRLLF